MKNPVLTGGVLILVAIAALIVGRSRLRPDSSQEGAAEGAAASPRTREAASGKSAPVAGREVGRSKRAKTAEEMQSAITNHLGLVDPTEARRNFAKILMALTPANAEATVEAWMLGRGLPGVWTAAVKGEYAALIKEWGGIDGTAAMSFADRLETGLNHRDWTRNSAISGWGAKNPEEALAWMKEHEDGNGPLTQQLLWGIAEHDIALATEYVLAAPDDPNAGGYIDRLARQQWASGGHDGASRWIRRLPEGPLKDRAVETISDFLAAEEQEISP